MQLIAFILGWILSAIAVVIFFRSYRLVQKAKPPEAPTIPGARPARDEEVFALLNWLVALMLLGIGGVLVFLCWPV